MSDRFKQLTRRARDWPDADWRCPWLQINVLLREMVHLFRDRSVRPVLKVEINNAVALGGTMKRGVWWN